MSNPRGGLGPNKGFFDKDMADLDITKSDVSTDPPYRATGRSSGPAGGNPEAFRRIRESWANLPSSGSPSPGYPGSNMTPSSPGTSTGGGGELVPYRGGTDLVPYRGGTDIVPYRGGGTGGGGADLVPYGGGSGGDVVPYGGAPTGPGGGSTPPRSPGGGSTPPGSSPGGGPRYRRVRQAADWINRNGGMTGLANGAAGNSTVDWNRALGGIHPALPAAVGAVKWAFTPTRTMTPGLSVEGQRVYYGGQQVDRIETRKRNVYPINRAGDGREHNRSLNEVEEINDAPPPIYGTLGGGMPQAYGQQSYPTYSPNASPQARMHRQPVDILNQQATGTLWGDTHTQATGTQWGPLHDRAVSGVEFPGSPRPEGIRRPQPPSSI